MAYLNRAKRTKKVTFTKSLKNTSPLSTVALSQAAHPLQVYRLYQQIRPIRILKKTTHRF